MLSNLETKTVYKFKHAAPVDMHLTWQEAEVLANDKAEWRQRVAQCSRLDAG